jgi:small subunit ribosomal protein S17
MNDGRGLRKTRIGIVVSDKMDKSVIVEVTRTVQHPLYNKYVRRRTRFMAHDEENACKNGDKVRIVETRPLSRRKRWRVQEKLA